jgi:hypothetical protein
MPCKPGAAPFAASPCAVREEPAGRAQQAQRLVAFRAARQGPPLPEPARKRLRLLLKSARQRAEAQAREQRGQASQLQAVWARQPPGMPSQEPQALKAEESPPWMAGQAFPQCGQVLHAEAPQPAVLLRRLDEAIYRAEQPRRQPEL